MPNGSSFSFEKQNAEPTKLPVATSNNDAQITQAIGSASADMLAEKANGVKQKTSHKEPVTQNISSVGMSINRCSPPSIQCL